MAAVTREVLIELLTAYAGDDYKESQNALIAAIVDDAIEEVRQAKYPFGYATEKSLEKQTADVLLRHPSNIRRIMEYHYDKIGKEGVTTFYEAGQTTSWEAGATPDSFFKGIIPNAHVF